MKIWFISDTHCWHESLAIPDADIVIHCGDEANARRVTANHSQALPFYQWYNELPIKYKIFVPGNHSVAFSEGLIEQSEFPSIIFLNHWKTEIEGLKIFGSPYTPTFGDWVFTRSRGKLASIWKTIPDDIDILVTHGPPKGVLDLTIDRDGDGKSLVQVGCKSLLNRVFEIKPKIHAFGHIHDEESYMNHGMFIRENIKFINASCCDIRGRFTHNGVIVDV